MQNVITTICSIGSVLTSLFILMKQFKEVKGAAKPANQLKISKKIFAVAMFVIIFPTIIYSFCGQAAKFEAGNDMLNNGSLVQAQKIFEDLNDYEMYARAKYSYAKQLYSTGQLREAYAIFEELDNYSSSKEYLNKIQTQLRYYDDTFDCSWAISDSLQSSIEETTYSKASALYENGEYERALEYFREISDYKDSEELSYACLLAMREKQVHTISAGISASVGIKYDGTVLSTDIKDSFDDTIWKDIVSISNMGIVTIALKEDGTVLSQGGLAIDVSNWADIIAVSAGERYAIGLKSDGTVLGAGHDAGDGQLGISNWTNITAIATGWRHTVGLDVDGAIYITGYGSSKQMKEINSNNSQWKDIIAIAAGGGSTTGQGMGHTVGLRADGSVVAVGDNAYGQCDVEGWENVVAIAAGDWHTVGLCRDGTVVSTHPDPNKYPDMYLGACNVDEWKKEDIVQIAAGSGYTLGLCSDGRVLAVGYNDCNQRDGVKNWEPIKVSDK